VFTGLTFSDRLFTPPLGDFQLYSKQGNPKLSQASIAIQVIKVKQAINSLINIMSLISYAKPVMNKRYSYPRVTAIRIDVHHARGNLTNTTQAFHAQSAYGPRPYVSHVVHI
jgi:hypothetical protein